MGELLVGFRFYPTESELILFYLQNKLDGQRDDMDRVIPDIDVFKYEPHHLPLAYGTYIDARVLLRAAELAAERCQEDKEQWFFFVPRQEREARGGRPSRTTESGYWKATGSPAPVFSADNRMIGVRKTMVFYVGKAPTGRKTKWKMNEYKAIDGQSNSSTVPKLRHEFSLCRLYVTSGSSRAFDRRPIEPYQTEPIVWSNGAEPSSSSPPHQARTMAQRPSSSETRQPNSEMFDGLNQPFWEWEEFNWA